MGCGCPGGGGGFGLWLPRGGVGGCLDAGGGEIHSLRDRELPGFVVEGFSVLCSGVQEERFEGVVAGETYGFCKESLVYGVASYVEWGQA